MKIILQAISPISHGDTMANQTNTRLFMRQNQIINGRATKAPAISENALRACMFRLPLHDDLLKRLEIDKGTLNQSVVNLLFSGGAMRSGSKAPSDEMRIGHELKKLYPSLDLLGGATDGFILPKGRLKLNAWIVARENQTAIDYIAPELSDEAKNNSLFDLVSDEVRTRGTGSESDGNQMIYQYETLAAGSKILLELSMDAHTPEVSLSALALALGNWDGFIGGQARQGRGRMVVLSHDLPSPDLYVNHINEQGELMKQGLIDGTFGTGKLLCS